MSGSLEAPDMNPPVDHAHLRNGADSASPPVVVCLHDAKGALLPIRAESGLLHCRSVVEVTRYLSRHVFPPDLVCYKLLLLRRTQTGDFPTTAPVAGTSEAGRIAEWTPYSTRAGTLALAGSQEAGPCTGLTIGHTLPLRQRALKELEPLHTWPPQCVFDPPPDSILTEAASTTLPHAAPRVIHVYALTSTSARRTEPNWEAGPTPGPHGAAPDHSHCAAAMTVYQGSGSMRSASSMTSAGNPTASVVSWQVRQGLTRTPSEVHSWVTAGSSCDALAATPTGAHPVTMVGHRAAGRGLGMRAVRSPLPRLTEGGAALVCPPAPLPRSTLPQAPRPPALVNSHRVTLAGSVGPTPPSGVALSAVEVGAVLVGGLSAAAVASPAGAVSPIRSLHATDGGVVALPSPGGASDAPMAGMEAASHARASEVASRGSEPNGGRSTEFPACIGVFMEAQSSGKSRYSRSSESARGDRQAHAPSSPPSPAARGEGGSGANLGTAPYGGRGGAPTSRSPARSRWDGSLGGSAPSPAWEASVGRVRQGRIMGGGVGGAQAAPQACGRAPGTSSLRAPTAHGLVWRNPVPPLAKRTLSLSLALHINDSAPLVRQLGHYASYEREQMERALLQYHPFFSTKAARAYMAGTLVVTGVVVGAGKASTGPTVTGHVRTTAAEPVTRPPPPPSSSMSSEHARLPELFRRYFHHVCYMAEVQRVPLPVVMHDTAALTRLLVPFLCPSTVTVRGGGESSAGPGEEVGDWVVLSAAEGRLVTRGGQLRVGATVGRPSQTVAPRAPCPGEHLNHPLTISELRGYLALTPDVAARLYASPLSDVDRGRQAHIAALQSRYAELTTALTRSGVTGSGRGVAPLSDATAVRLLRGAHDVMERAMEALPFVAWTAAREAAAADSVSQRTRPRTAPESDEDRWELWESFDQGLERAVSATLSGSPPSATHGPPPPPSSLPVADVLSWESPPVGAQMALEEIDAALAATSWMTCIEDVVRNRVARVENVVAVVEAIRANPNTIVNLWYNSEGEAMQALKAVVQAVSVWARKS